MSRGVCPFGPVPVEGLYLSLDLLVVISPVSRTLYLSVIVPSALALGPSITNGVSLAFSTLFLLSFSLRLYYLLSLVPAC